jgi:hypothetical protein
MRRNERLKLIARVRKQARNELLAEIRAKEKLEREQLEALDRQHRARERKRQEVEHKEAVRNLELYDRTFEQISQAETELFQNSPAFLKYQQLRRSMGDKKRTHGLQNGNWKAP